MAMWKKNSQLPAVENCNKMTKIKVAALQMPTVHDKMENVKAVGAYLEQLKDENLDSLFLGNPIYTKVRDDNPTRYINGSKAKNVMVADGCVIEGEIENSILFRGVKVAKGAKVKNCILMQDTVIEDNASVEYVITDKNVTISEGKSLTGNDTFQVYVAKGQVV